LTSWPLPQPPPAAPVEDSPTPTLETPPINLECSPVGIMPKRDRLAEETGHVYDRFSNLPPEEFVRGFDSIEAAVDNTLEAFGETDPAVRDAMVTYLQTKLD
jgi:hypothetical protein